ncbi:MAG: nitroreductase family protein [candidate division WOR-3 bacterium]|nr:nitroreductase family protein [candidate division WOR-3 bacterium]
MSDTLKIIKERHSVRMPFDPSRPIAKQDLRQILEAGRWAPTAHNMQNFEIVVVDDKMALQELGNIKRTVSETFIRENYQQLSFSEEELLRKKVGLLGTNFPPSWRTPGVKPIVEEGSMRPLLTCPTLLVVLYDPGRRAPASEGNFLGIISLGCMIENLWLAANSLGIDFHIVSSLADGPVEKEVKRNLAVPEHLRVVLSIRLGYAAAGPARHPRVRRDIEDFSHHNRFGNKGID